MARGSIGAPDDETRLAIAFLGVVGASCVASAASTLPSLRAQRSVNSLPLTTEALRGKVVLADFWEYTCVNWIRTAPYVKAWNRVYGPLGLVVIGVHAPEFEFGKAPTTSTEEFVTTD